MHKRVAMLYKKLFFSPFLCILITILFMFENLSWAYGYGPVSFSSLSQTVQLPPQIDNIFEKLYGRPIGPIERHFLANLVRDYGPDYLYERLLDSSNDRADLWQAISSCGDKALESLLLAQGVDPDNLPAFAYMADMVSEVGKVKGALSLYSLALVAAYKGLSLIPIKVGRLEDLPSDSIVLLKTKDPKVGHYVYLAAKKKGLLLVIDNHIPRFVSLKTMDDRFSGYALVRAADISGMRKRPLRLSIREARQVYGSRTYRRFIRKATPEDFLDPDDFLPGMELKDVLTNAGITIVSAAVAPYLPGAQVSSFGEAYAVAQVANFATQFSVTVLDMDPKMASVMGSAVGGATGGGISGGWGGALKGLGTGALQGTLQVGISEGLKPVISDPMARNLMSGMLASVGTGAITSGISKAWQAHQNAGQVGANGDLGAQVEPVEIGGEAGSENVFQVEEMCSDTSNTGLFSELGISDLAETPSGHIYSTSSPGIGIQDGVLVANASWGQDFLSGISDFWSVNKGAIVRDFVTTGIKVAALESGFLKDDFSRAFVSTVGGEVMGSLVTGGKVTDFGMWKNVIWSGLKQGAMDLAVSKVEELLINPDKYGRARGLSTMGIMMAAGTVLPRVTGAADSWQAALTNSVSALTNSVSSIGGVLSTWNVPEAPKPGDFAGKAQYQYQYAKYFNNLMSTAGVSTLPAVVETMKMQGVTDWKSQKFMPSGIDVFGNMINAGVHNVSVNLFQRNVVGSLNSWNPLSNKVFRIYSKNSRPVSKGLLAEQLSQAVGKLKEMEQENNKGFLHRLHNAMFGWMDENALFSGYEFKEWANIGSRDIGGWISELYFAPTGNIFGATEFLEKKKNGISHEHVMRQWISPNNSLGIAPRESFLSLDGATYIKPGGERSLVGWEEILNTKPGETISVNEIYDFASGEKDIAEKAVTSNIGAGYLVTFNPEGRNKETIVSLSKNLPLDELGQSKIGKLREIGALDARRDGNIRFAITAIGQTDRTGETHIIGGGMIDFQKAHIISSANQNGENILTSSIPMRRKKPFSHQVAYVEEVGDMLVWSVFGAERFLAGSPTNSYGVKFQEVQPGATPGFTVSLGHTGPVLFDLTNTTVVAQDNVTIKNISRYGNPERFSLSIVTSLDSRIRSNMPNTFRNFSSAIAQVGWTTVDPEEIYYTASFDKIGNLAPGTSAVITRDNVREFAYDTGFGREMLKFERPITILKSIDTFKQANGGFGLSKNILGGIGESNGVSARHKSLGEENWISGTADLDRLMFTPQKKMQSIFSAPKLPEKPNHDMASNGQLNQAQVKPHPIEATEIGRIKADNKLEFPAETSIPIRTQASIQSDPILGGVEDMGEGGMVSRDILRNLKLTIPDNVAGKGFAPWFGRNGNLDVLRVGTKIENGMGKGFVGGHIQFKNFSVAGYSSLNGMPNSRLFLEKTSLDNTVTMTTLTLAYGDKHRIESVGNNKSLWFVMDNDMKFNMINERIGFDGNTLSKAGAGYSIPDNRINGAYSIFASNSMGFDVHANIVNPKPELPAANVTTQTRSQSLSISPINGGPKGPKGIKLPQNIKDKLIEGITFSELQRINPQLASSLKTKLKIRPGTEGLTQLKLENDHIVSGIKPGVYSPDNLKKAGIISEGEAARLRGLEKQGLIKGVAIQNGEKPSIKWNDGEYKLTPEQAKELLGVNPGDKANQVAVTIKEGKIQNITAYMPWKRTTVSQVNGAPQSAPETAHSVLLYDISKNSAVPGVRVTPEVINELSTKLTKDPDSALKGNWYYSQLNGYLNKGDTQGLQRFLDNNPEARAIAIGALGNIVKTGSKEYNKGKDFNTTVTYYSLYGEKGLPIFISSSVTQNIKDSDSFHSLGVAYFKTDKGIVSGSQLLYAGKFADLDVASAGNGGGQSGPLLPENTYAAEVSKINKNGKGYIIYNLNWNMGDGFWKNTLGSNHGLKPGLLVNFGKDSFSVDYRNTTFFGSKTIKDTYLFGLNNGSINPHYKYNGNDYWIVAFNRKNQIYNGRANITNLENEILTQVIDPKTGKPFLTRLTAKKDSIKTQYIINGKNNITRNILNETKVDIFGLNGTKTTGILNGNNLVLNGKAILPLVANDITAKGGNHKPPKPKNEKATQVKAAFKGRDALTNFFEFANGSSLGLNNRFSAVMFSNTAGTGRATLSGGFLSPKLWNNLDIKIENKDLAKKGIAFAYKRGMGENGIYAIYTGNKNDKAFNFDKGNISIAKGNITSNKDLRLLITPFKGKQAVIRTLTANEKNTGKVFLRGQELEFLKGAAEHSFSLSSIKNGQVYFFADNKSYSIEKTDNGWKINGKGQRFIAYQPGGSNSGNAKNFGAKGKKIKMTRVNVRLELDKNKNGIFRTDKQFGNITMTSNIGFTGMISQSPRVELQFSGSGRPVDGTIAGKIDGTGKQVSITNLKNASGFLYNPYKGFISTKSASGEITASLKNATTYVNVVYLTPTEGMTESQREAFKALIKVGWKGLSSDKKKLIESYMGNNKQMKDFISYVKKGQWNSIREQLNNEKNNLPFKIGEATVSVKSMTIQGSNQGFKYNGINGSLSFDVVKNKDGKNIPIPINNASADNGMLKVTAGDKSAPLLLSIGKMPEGRPNPNSLPSRVVKVFSEDGIIFAEKGAEYGINNIGGMAAAYGNGGVSVTGLHNDVIYYTEGREPLRFVSSIAYNDSDKHSLEMISAIPEGRYKGDVPDWHDAKNGPFYFSFSEVIKNGAYKTRWMHDEGGRDIDKYFVQIGVNSSNTYSIEKLAELAKNPAFSGVWTVPRFDNSGNFSGFSDIEFRAISDRDNVSKVVGIGFVDNGLKRSLLDALKSWKKVNPSDFSAATRQLFNDKNVDLSKLHYSDLQALNYMRMKMTTLPLMRKNKLLLAIAKDPSLKKYVKTWIERENKRGVVFLNDKPMTLLDLANLQDELSKVGDKQIKRWAEDYLNANSAGGIAGFWAESVVQGLAHIVGGQTLTDEKMQVLRMLIGEDRLDRIDIGGGLYKAAKYAGYGFAMFTQLPPAIANGVMIGELSGAVGGGVATLLFGDAAGTVGGIIGEAVVDMAINAGGQAVFNKGDINWYSVAFTGAIGGAVGVTGALGIANKIASGANSVIKRVSLPVSEDVIKKVAGKIGIGTSEAKVAIEVGEDASKAVSSGSIGRKIVKFAGDTVKEAMASTIVQGIGTGVGYAYSYEEGKSEFPSRWDAFREGFSMGADIGLVFGGITKTTGRALRSGLRSLASAGEKKAVGYMSGSVMEMAKSAVKETVREVIPSSIPGAGYSLGTGLAASTFFIPYKGGSVASDLISSITSPIHKGIDYVVRNYLMDPNEVGNASVQQYLKSKYIQTKDSSYLWKGVALSATQTAADMFALGLLFRGAGKLTQRSNFMASAAFNLANTMMVVRPFYIEAAKSAGFLITNWDTKNYGEFYDAVTNLGGVLAGAPLAHVAGERVMEGAAKVGRGAVKFGYEKFVGERGRLEIEAGQAGFVSRGVKAPIVKLYDNYVEPVKAAAKAEASAGSGSSKSGIASRAWNFTKDLGTSAIREGVMIGVGAMLGDLIMTGALAYRDVVNTAVGHVMQKRMEAYGRLGEALGEREFNGMRSSLSTMDPTAKAIFNAVYREQVTSEGSEYVSRLGKVVSNVIGIADRVQNVSGATNAAMIGKLEKAFNEGVSYNDFVNEVKQNVEQSGGKASEGVKASTDAVYNELHSRINMAERKARLLGALKDGGRFIVGNRRVEISNGGKAIDIREIANEKEMKQLKEEDGIEEYSAGEVLGALKQVEQEDGGFSTDGRGALAGMFKQMAVDRLNKTGVEINGIENITTEDLINNHLGSEKITTKEQVDAMGQLIQAKAWEEGIEDKDLNSMLSKRRLEIWRENESTVNEWMKERQLIPKGDDRASMLKRRALMSSMKDAVMSSSRNFIRIDKGALNEASNFKTALESLAKHSDVAQRYFDFERTAQDMAKKSFFELSSKEDIARVTAGVGNLNAERTVAAKYGEEVANIGKRIIEKIGDRKFGDIEEERKTVQDKAEAWARGEGLDPTKVRQAALDYWGLKKAHEVFNEAFGGEFKAKDIQKVDMLFSTFGSHLEAAMGGGKTYATLLLALQQGFARDAASELWLANDQLVDNFLKDSAVQASLRKAGMKVLFITSDSGFANKYSGREGVDAIDTTNAGKEQIEDYLDAVKDNHTLIIGSYTARAHFLNKVKTTGKVIAYENGISDAAKAGRRIFIDEEAMFRDSTAAIIGDGGESVAGYAEEADRLWDAIEKMALNSKGGVEQFLRDNFDITDSGVTVKSNSELAKNLEREIGEGKVNWDIVRGIGKVMAEVMEIRTNEREMSFSDDLIWNPENGRYAFDVKSNGKPDPSRITKDKGYAAAKVVFARRLVDKFGDTKDVLEEKGNDSMANEWLRKQRELHSVLEKNGLNKRTAEQAIENTRAGGRTIVSTSPMDMLAGEFSAGTDVTVLSGTLSDLNPLMRVITGKSVKTVGRPFMWVGDEDGSIKILMGDEKKMATKLTAKIVNNGNDVDAVVRDIIDTLKKGRDVYISITDASARAEIKNKLAEALKDELNKDGLKDEERQNLYEAIRFEGSMGEGDMERCIKEFVEGADYTASDEKLQELESAVRTMGTDRAKSRLVIVNEIGHRGLTIGKDAEKGGASIEREVDLLAYINKYGEQADVYQLSARINRVGEMLDAEKVGEAKIYLSKDLFDAALNGDFVRDNEEMLTSRLKEMRDIQQEGIKKSEQDYKKAKINNPSAIDYVELFKRARDGGKLSNEEKLSLYLAISHIKQSTEMAYSKVSDFADAYFFGQKWHRFMAVVRDAAKIKGSGISESDALKIAEVYDEILNPVNDSYELDKGEMKDMTPEEKMRKTFDRIKGRMGEAMDAMERKGVSSTAKEAFRRMVGFDELEEFIDGKAKEGNTYAEFSKKAFGRDIFRDAKESSKPLEVSENKAETEGVSEVKEKDISYAQNKDSADYENNAAMDLDTHVSTSKEFIPEGRKTATELADEVVSVMEKATGLEFSHADRARVARQIAAMPVNTMNTPQSVANNLLNVISSSIASSQGSINNAINTINSAAMANPSAAINLDSALSAVMQSPAVMQIAEENSPGFAKAVENVASSNTMTKQDMDVILSGLEAAKEKIEKRAQITEQVLQGLRQNKKLNNPDTSAMEKIQIIDSTVKGVVENLKGSVEKDELKGIERALMSVKDAIVPVFVNPLMTAQEARAAALAEEMLWNRIKPAAKKLDISRKDIGRLIATEFMKSNKNGVGLEDFVKQLEWKLKAPRKALSSRMATASMRWQRQAVKVKMAKGFWNKAGESIALAGYVARSLLSPSFVVESQMRVSLGSRDRKKIVLSDAVSNLNTGAEGLSAPHFARRLVNKMFAVSDAPDSIFMRPISWAASKAMGWNKSERADRIALLSGLSSIKRDNELGLIPKIRRSMTLPNIAGSKAGQIATTVAVAGVGAGMLGFIGASAFGLFGAASLLKMASLPLSAFAVAKVVAPAFWSGEKWGPKLGDVDAAASGDSSTFAGFASKLGVDNQIIKGISADERAKLALAMANPTVSVKKYNKIRKDITSIMKSMGYKEDEIGSMLSSASAADILEFGKKGKDVKAIDRLKALSRIMPKTSVWSKVFAEASNNLNPVSGIMSMLGKLPGMDRFLGKAEDMERNIAYRELARAIANHKDEILREIRTENANTEEDAFNKLSMDIYHLIGRGDVSSHPVQSMNFVNDLKAFSNEDKGWLSRRVGRLIGVEKRLFGNTYYLSMIGGQLVGMALGSPLLGIGAAASVFAAPAIGALSGKVKRGESFWKGLQSAQVSTLSILMGFAGVGAMGYVPGIAGAVVSSFHSGSNVIGLGMAGLGAAGLAALMKKRIAPLRIKMARAAMRGKSFIKNLPDMLPLPSMLASEQGSINMGRKANAKSDNVLATSPAQKGDNSAISNEADVAEDTDTGVWMRLRARLRDLIRGTRFGIEAVPAPDMKDKAMEITLSFEPYDLRSVFEISHHRMGVVDKVKLGLYKGMITLWLGKAGHRFDGEIIFVKGSHFSDPLMQGSVMIVPVELMANQVQAKEKILSLLGVRNKGGVEEAVERLLLSSRDINIQERLHLSHAFVDVARFLERQGYSDSEIGKAISSIWYIKKAARPIIFNDMGVLKVYSSLISEEASGYEERTKAVFLRAGIYYNLLSRLQPGLSDEERLFKMFDYMSYQIRKISKKSLAYYMARFLSVFGKEKDVYKLKELIETGIGASRDAMRNYRFFSMDMEDVLRHYRKWLKYRLRFVLPYGMEFIIERVKAASQAASDLFNRFYHRVILHTPSEEVKKAFELAV